MSASPHVYIRSVINLPCSTKNLGFFILVDGITWIRKGWHFFLMYTQFPNKTQAPLSLYILLKHCSHSCVLIMCHLSSSYWNCLPLLQPSFILKPGMEISQISSTFFLHSLLHILLKSDISASITKYSPSFLGRLHPRCVGEVSPEQNLKFYT